MKTALAVVLSIALVAGALYVRAEFLSGDGPAVADGSEVPSGAGDVAVACDEALGDGCPAGATRLDLGGLLDAFAGQGQGHEVLVAPSIVVDLIIGSPNSQVTFGDDRRVVATTPLVLAVAPSRADVVAGACGQEVTWSCVAGLVGDGLTPGLPDPVGRSDGLAALAAMTGGHLGTPGYSANAFSGGAFLSWLDTVRTGTERTTQALVNLIRFAGAQNDSAVVLEGPALRTVSSAAQNVPDLHWPTPVAHLSVVAVGVDGAEVDDVADAAADALAATGWRGADGAPLEEGPELPDDDGLPSGAVLFTLRSRVN